MLFSLNEKGKMSLHFAGVMGFFVVVALTCQGIVSLFSTGVFPAGW